MKPLKNHFEYCATKIIILCIPFLFFERNLFSQTFYYLQERNITVYDTIIYYKPNGTLAQRAVISPEELSEDEIISITEDWKNAYAIEGVFEVLSPATSVYNCFGYAFSITERSDTVYFGKGGYANIVRKFTLDQSTDGGQLF